MLENLREDWPVWGLFSIIFTLLGLLIWIIIEHNAWHQLHHCKETGQQFTDVVLQSFPSGDGKTTTLIPQIVTHYQYSCDVGVHWD